MHAVWLRARSELRSRLASVLVLALIVGVLGGIVIAAAAGARRADSAYPRFLLAERGIDVALDASSRDRHLLLRTLHEAASLPQVQATSLLGFAEGRPDVPGVHSNAPIFPLISEDGRFGTSINRIKILEGRMWRPTAPNEVVLSYPVANEFHLHAGETFRFRYGNPFGAFVPSPQHTVAPSPLTLHVVGVGAAPSMFQTLAGSYLSAMVFPPAFAHVHTRYLEPHTLHLAVKLRRGFADAKIYAREVKGIGQRVAPAGHIKVGFNAHQQTIGVEQATHVQAVALWVLAALVALAGIAVFAQAMARQTFLESLEYPTLRSIGMTPNQLMAVGMIRAAAVGVAGAVVAVVVGYLLSWFTPTGVARLAEPNPGFAFDGLAMGLGAIVVTCIVVASAAIPAWRSAIAQGSALGTAESRTSRRPSSVPTLMARSAFPPTATTGVKMALDPGRGRSAVPVRTAMLSVALSLLALAAALGFGTSLRYLQKTPALSGVNWDALTFVGTAGPNAAEGRAYLRFLRTDPRVQGYSAGTIAEVQIGKLALPAIAMHPERGNVTPAVVAGRLPRNDSEVMIGSETMRRLGLSIGETVRVQGRDRALRMRIVGRVAFPVFFFSFTRPGQGLAMTTGAVNRLIPQRGGVGTFIRLQPGVRTSAFIADVRHRFPDVFFAPTEVGDTVRNLSGVGNVPLILAAIVAIMAAITLAHTLITSIRRRRLDLAILKTLGFLRHQVSATVAWQATTLALISAAIGIPLGVVAGRWTWNVFADHLGVVPKAVVPSVAVLLAVPVTFVVANLLAVIPGRVASRLKAATVMRTE